jgi:hypothetical protein
MFRFSCQTTNINVQCEDPYDTPICNLPCQHFCKALLWNFQYDQTLSTDFAWLTPVSRILQNDRTKWHCWIGFRCTRFESRPYWPLIVTENPFLFLSNTNSHSRPQVIKYSKFCEINLKWRRNMKHGWRL